MYIIENYGKEREKDLCVLVYLYINIYVHWHRETIECGKMNGECIQYVCIISHNDFGLDNKLAVYTAHVYIICVYCICAMSRDSRGTFFFVILYSSK